MPCASFAITFAVAGATRTTCASRTKRMCGMRSGASQSDAYTGRPVSDANVSGADESFRFGRHDDVDDRAGCTSVLVKAAALYAAMPPADAEQDASAVHYPASRRDPE